MTADGYTETLRDDCVDFLTRHARHRLETLRPTPGGRRPRAPLWDAMGPTYWEVIERRARRPWSRDARAHVGAPLRYRVLPGRVVAERRRDRDPRGRHPPPDRRALYPGRRARAEARGLRGGVQGDRVGPRSRDVRDAATTSPSDPTLSVAKLPADGARDASPRGAPTSSTRPTRELIARASPAADDDPDAFTVLVRQRVRIEGSSPRPPLRRASRGQAAACGRARPGAGGRRTPRSRSAW